MIVLSEPRASASSLVTPGARVSNDIPDNGGSPIVETAGNRPPLPYLTIDIGGGHSGAVKGGKALGLQPWAFAVRRFIGTLPVQETNVRVSGNLLGHDQEALGPSCVTAASSRSSSGRPRRAKGAKKAYSPTFYMSLDKTPFPKGARDYVRIFASANSW